MEDESYRLTADRATGRIEIFDKESSNSVVPGTWKVQETLPVRPYEISTVRLTTP